MKINLEAKPIRKADWIEEDGRVRIKVIKFKSKFGRWLCRVFKKPNFFFINLDEIGSFIWKRCNGKKTVEQILEELEETYGEEKMKERLYFFLLSLKKYGYIEFEGEE